MKGEGDKTKITVREVCIPDTMTKFASLCWEQSFDKLEESPK